MKKIGIIGEDPNDTSSIQNLLTKKYPKLFSCKPLLKNKRGYQLDNASTENSLKAEFATEKPDIVVFVRDVDGLVTEAEKIKKVKNWFNKLNPLVGNKGILLHNIFELEALILADIETFNKIYATTIKHQGDVTYKKEPKEFLISKTKNLKKKYKESHCPDIFKELNFDTVANNCTYFKAFNTEFLKALHPPKKGK